MATLETFLVLSFLSSLTPTGAETCQSSRCPQIHSPSLQSNPTIQFPFRQKSQPDRCGYPGFDLSCNGRNQTIISMPSSGDFTVTSIDYWDQQIQVNDPENCMPGRYLHNSSAVDFPFELDVRSRDEPRSFTFLNCTANVTYPYFFMRFPCLGGPNYTVGAMLSGDYGRLSEDRPCREIKTVSLSLEYWDGSGTGFYRDVSLTWAEPDCGPCRRQGGSCGFKSRSNLEIACSRRSFGAPKEGLSKGAKYGMLMGAGVCGIVLLSVLAFRFSDRRDHRPLTSVATWVAPQPAAVTTGLSRSVIESYTKFMFGDGGLSEAVNPTCPICLCEYKPNEEVRVIPDCKHYFHVDCIDEWLQRHATCPLCRVSARTASFPGVSPSLSHASTMENPMHLLP